jgi:hypothetical protein
MIDVTKISATIICGLLIFWLGIEFKVHKVSAEAIKEVTKSQELDVYSGDKTHPVKLELKLLQTNTKLVQGGVVTESTKDKLSIVETVYSVRARAFGGDVYLPAYQEQIVFEPIFVTPVEGTHAVVPGTPSIKLSRPLIKKGDRYILKEYEEVDMYITTPVKVLHKDIPTRLVFKTKLNTLAWHPTVYANGSFDGGLDIATGERLVNIPLTNATYIPEQITRVDWVSDPAVIVKSEAYINAYKAATQNQASVFSIFRQLFSKDFGNNK